MNPNTKKQIQSLLFRRRVTVMRGSTVILNLPLIFILLAMLTAPWLAALGFACALMQGCQFSIENNAAPFCDLGAEGSGEESDSVL